jgi:hypothetical protein
LAERVVGDARGVLIRRWPIHVEGGGQRQPGATCASCCCWCWCCCCC